MHRGGEGVVIMSNSDNGNHLTTELLNGIAAVYGWTDYAPTQKKLLAISPDQLALFAGTYDLGRGTLIKVSRRGDALYARGNHGHLHRIYPQSPLRFFMLDEDADITFTQSASGLVNGLMVYGQQAKKIK